MQIYIVIVVVTVVFGKQDSTVVIIMDFKEQIMIKLKII